MPLPPLTEKRAVDDLRIFFREKPFLFFGTGMSCALDPRFGMPALKDALLAGDSLSSLSPSQTQEWSRFRTALDSGLDLESALAAVTDQGLLKKITDATGAFVAGIDREYAFRIAHCEAEWPAGRFLKRLVDTLPESDPTLHAVTPNYDLLCEHACDSLGVPYTNGFIGGIQRKRDWDAAERSLLVPSKVNRRGRLVPSFRIRKHLRLYKVHGSLNYFFHKNEVIQNDAWMWAPPRDARRVMITPGLTKYEMLQYYRRELLQSADAAISEASHFLFLGYGFNDSHLEEYIRRKLIAQSCHGLIVTRDSNPRIESLLPDARNLWLVCKSVDTDAEGTRVFNNNFADWLQLPGRNLWQIPEFSAHFLGG